jgi:hypothetical protein
MSAPRGGGDWKEWSQHVLIEISRLHEGQKEIQSEQNEINKTLSRNTDQLEIHIEGVKIARKEAGEARELAQEGIVGLADRMDKRFQPLELYKVQVSAYWKVVTIAALSPAAIYYLMQIVKLLKG